MEEENQQKAKQNAALELSVSQRNSQSTSSFEALGGGHQGFHGGFSNRLDSGNFRMSRPTVLGGMSAPPGFPPSAQQLSPDKSGNFTLGGTDSI